MSPDQTHRYRYRLVAMHLSTIPPTLGFVLMIEAFLLLVIVSPVLSAGVTVTHLPGFNGPVPFYLETGYLNVDERLELFYYFLQSERNPTEDPVILWLTGGPGCSAFSGLVFEIGPLKFVNANYNGSLPSLLYNPYSWTKVANIIFLDSPVGTGFSFSRFPEAYEVDDTTSSVHISKALLKWYSEHPHFLSNPLYIAGDSYAGKIVPIVTNILATGNNGHQFLNLKGYLIGNPATSELLDMNSRIPYAYGAGIISMELFKEIEGHCQGEDYFNPDPKNSLCCSALDKFQQLYKELQTSHILEQKCPLVSPKPDNLNRGRRSLEEMKGELLLAPEAPDLHCRSYAYYLSYHWANNDATKEALHIKKGTVDEWVRCNNSLSYTKNVKSILQYHLNLTRSGYRALVYSGDQDIVVPHVGTQAWIRSLNFSIIDDWRSWHVDGQVAGYTRKYDNDLTFATVKNAGHTAPEYQPRNCLVMLERWISHDKL